MTNHLAIAVTQISKQYKLYNHPKDRLKEALHPFKKKYHHEFHALADISFAVKKGEIVGILGKNGAGKSTLLKIITGVLTPSSGTVTVTGKVASLLELGAGFNPEYTGLENIYFQGSLMGYTREEMAVRVQSILEFADIGEFIHQPVKMYSSGMFARLAFSVSINVEPDVLIVDEALSVGDMAFQEKSILKMKELMQKGRAILFVSHNLPSIRNFCDRAIWMEQGKIKEEGIAHIICERYENSMAKNDTYIAVKNIEQTQHEVPDKRFFLKNIVLSAESIMTTLPLNITLEIGRQANIKQDDVALGILIYDEKGNLVTLFSTLRDDFVLDLSNTQTVTLTIPKVNLLKGCYFISVSISDTAGMFSYDKQDFCAKLTVTSQLNGKGLPIAEGNFWSEHQWII